MISFNVPEFDKSLGIEFYVSSAPGIGGIIKYKTEDFIVEEINEQGIVYRSSLLGDFTPPPSPTTGPYVFTIIERWGLDHHETIRLLCKKLNVKPSQIGIAGIKDRRAVITQGLTIKGINPSDLQKINLRKIKILWTGFSLGPLRPGMLYGNQFTVCIRNIDSSSEHDLANHIFSIIKEIEELGGLANFYGYQRFGIPRASSHLVGKYIVKSDFESAVMKFIGSPVIGEPKTHIEARRTFDETMDPVKTLKVMPRELHFERIVLKYLIKHPEDYVGALERLPKNLLRLFVESYGSYIFNKFLSERVRNGLSLIETTDGDLIALTDSHGYQSTRILIANKTISTSEANNLIRLGKAVLVITVPGYIVKLADGIQGEIQHKILAEEKVRLKDFKVPALKKKLYVTGGYRQPLINIENFSIVKIYNDDIFNGRKLMTIRFRLKRGSYATNLLREIMKPKNHLSYVGIININKN
ncbi:MAG: tRNA pseudouridine(13) synthase TruD [Thermoprotei archaeon]